MIVALIFSILFSLAVGITAARNKRAETIIIPLLDVFQSIPILGFFPIVIVGIIDVLPGAAGVNLAVIFLIFTSMSWNIAFGVYGAVKSIPQDYLDLSSLSNSGSLQRIFSLYIPSSLASIAYNTQISWAVGLFYLISSEVISAGVVNTQVPGIGTAILNFGTPGPLANYDGYLYSLLILVIAVTIWQFLFLREFSVWAEKYRFGDDPRAGRKDALMKMYSWVNQRSISKLFLIRPGLGVTTMTSSLSRFKRGFKYALIILIVLFLAIETPSVAMAVRNGVTASLISSLPADESVVLIGLALSFVRIWYVYFITVLIAVPVGVVIALHERAYNALVPLIEVIASIPGPALLPALVPFTLLAGGFAGELTAAIIIFLGMVWYVLFNVMAGIRTLPGDLWELRRSLMVSTSQAWRSIYLPAIATSFVTGSITAIGAAWNTLIVAEYFGISGETPLTQVGDGIGKIIVVATYNQGAASIVYNGVSISPGLTLALAILSMTALVVCFNLTVWRRVYHYATKRFAYNR